MVASPHGPPDETDGYQGQDAKNDYGHIFPLACLKPLMLYCEWSVLTVHYIGRGSVVPFQDGSGR